MGDARNNELPFDGKAIIGMVHIQALPGTPQHHLPMAEITATAAREARQWVAAGCDGLIVENMHDRPYLNRHVGPQIVACMTAALEAVTEVAGVPVGVQILAGANREALAVAQSCGAAFIRAEGFVFAHVADEGFMPGADAGPLLRYRREINALDVAVLADVKKKHASHAMTADITLAETATAATFFGADGIVVTGAATAQATAVRDVREVADAVDVPVAVGSGLSADNLATYWPHAELFIIGSAVKVGGLWSNPLDAQRLEAFMDAARALRRGR